MQFPLTLKYQTLCQNEKDSNKALQKLLEEEKLKSKMSKKQRKQIQEMEIEGKESPLINHYKALIQEVNVQSTANAVANEKQTSAIRMAEMERLYEKNVLKK